MRLVVDNRDLHPLRKRMMIESCGTWDACCLYRDWPIKRKCRNIIYSTRGVHDWSDVSKVKLEEDADAVLKYYNIKASSFDVVLEDPRCVLQTDVGATLSIACRDDISDDLADRARVLCKVAGQIPHITSNTKVKFIEPPSRDGIYPTGRSDEEIPDLPVVAAFTENESVINLLTEENTFLLSVMYTRWLL